MRLWNFDGEIRLKAHCCVQPGNRFREASLEDVICWILEREETVWGPIKDAVEPPQPPEPSLLQRAIQRARGPLT